MRPPPSGLSWAVGLPPAHGEMIVRSSKPPAPRLLIVDDDPEVLRALTFLAETRGFEVRRCAAASDALASCTTGDLYVCLVIDQKLPDLPGIDLLSQLRDRGIHAPAILITTGPSPTLKRLAGEAGVVIVEKPLLTDMLFTEIHRLIDGD